MRRLIAVVLSSVAVTLALVLPASAATLTKVVWYHGYHVVVPADWPVYSLDRTPGVCVRFNRHAVYLGRPGATESCATQAAGRTEAILIEPLNGPPANAGSASLVDRAHGVAVTVTWNADPGLIARALGLPTLDRLAQVRRRADPLAHAAALRYGVRAAAAPATPGEAYTGLAFDACSAPSLAKMAAWGASAYRAVGVYIGGANMACAQPNLTSSWVAAQSARGWHLIPTYVGLQAPSNSCGCAAIRPRLAASEGSAAARDAVAQAQAIGLGTGNPIYYDMEAYARTRRNTKAVLAFLQAWTQTLHASGYKSGVYSSEASGIEDLALQVGTAYTEPDEIWIASWNGARTTLDPQLPASYWGDHQRLHQYRGDHNERHGRATINIDSDYVDAATAAVGSASAGGAIASPAPTPAQPAWRTSAPPQAWCSAGSRRGPRLRRLSRPTRSLSRALSSCRGR